MAQSRLIRGALILQAAVFLSKFLGMIYTIPFEALVGTKGGALYSYAYIPYTVILSLSTLGIPMAVSKFVSKYNALGDYQTGMRLFRSGLILMTMTGFLAFLALFFLAPVIASYVIGEYPQSGNREEDVVFVIRMVSTALIIVPAMSLMRGYFQGFQSMGPTGVSQVVEQIVRISFSLTGAFIVIKIVGGTKAVAVSFATFAAFVGALGGLFVLIRYWRKRKDHLDQLVATSIVHKRISLLSIYRELITYAVPFVVVGLAIPVYQLIDQFTVNQTLTGELGFNQDQAAVVYSNLSFYVHKLLMIPVSLSTALAVSLVPAITSSYSSQNYRDLQKQITQAFQFVLFLTIPAAAGLSILSYSAYGAMYGIENIATGGLILRWYAPTALLFALFSVTAAILQGINQQRFAVFSLLVGILLKMILNEFFIVHFEVIGAIIATDIGFLFSVAFNVFVIWTFAHYRFGLVLRRGLLIIIFTLIMAVTVFLVTLPFGSGLPESFWGAVMTLIIGVIFGCGSFTWLSLRSGLAEIVLGGRLSFLKRKGKEDSGQ